MSADAQIVTQAIKYSSCIHILGKHPQSSPSPQLPYPYIQLATSASVYCPELQSKLQPEVPQPKKIFVEGNLIAIIDYYDNLWLLSELFPFQINVSMLLSRKIKQVFLGEGECILASKKCPVLLNWGAKNIIDVSNCQTLKLNQKYFKNASGFFTAYQLANNNKDDKFFYSNIKKIDNSNKLYHFKTQTLQEEHATNQTNLMKRNKLSRKKARPTGQQAQTYNIIAYPTYQSSLMRSKVVGISVGKVHCMCWDVNGALYTWGHRTIALGYSELPSEKVTTRPKRVEGMNNLFVTMGYAATHYSLALSSEGSLYEWGIKKTANVINEQLIFQPRVLDFESRVIMLKGKQDAFACLNSKHQLFLWGAKSAKFLSSEIQEKMQFKNGFIYDPFLVPHLQNKKIVDFGIGDEFIAILIAKSQVIPSQQEKIYWNDMIKRVKTRLKFGSNIKTEFNRESQPCDSKFEDQEMTPSQVAHINEQPSQSKIEKAYEERKLKKQYFQSLKSEEKLFINLLKTKKQSFVNIQEKNQLKKGLTHRFLSQRNDWTQKIITASMKKKSVQKDNNQLTPFIDKKHAQYLQMTQLAVQNAKKFIRENFSEALKQVNQTKISRQKESNQNRKKLKDFSSSKLKTQSYEMRLQRVQMRKKSLQQSYIAEVSIKLKQNSIEYRNKRHEEIMQAKNKQKHRNMLKNTLYAYLVKNYIIKLLVSPIQEARRVKIEQFAKGLHLSRIQKNLRIIFIKTRVRHRLKKLQKLNFLTYALLCTVFKKFVKKRREQKNKLMRKIVAQQLYKNVLKQKIRFGISKTHLNTKKIQKFGEWLKMVKVERIRCLKVLWKNFLLATMKITNDADAINICKTQQSCTFQELYKQKISLNPMLNLETFLNKSPIFQIRFQYFQSIIYLFRKDNKMKSQKMLKSMKAIKRKPKIKFNGQGQMVAVTNGLQGSPDLLPYSLHYNLLVRPKSMQLNIPESLKRSERWIREEAAIFEKILNQIIENHEKSFLKAKRQYDIDLAYFIREKYETLSQKRWKSIIEYNQIKMTPYKKKKQKELYRIFGLIGMQRILNEDYLPQKYLMLEQAIKKREAPVPPNSYIAFDIHSFKQAFKKYYEALSIKAKYFRKNFL